MILNDTQKREVLKILEMETSKLDSLNIEALPLIENVFLNFELEDIKINLIENFLNCLETEHFFYFTDAIDYLKEEDCSLRESLNLAKEFGLLDAKDITNISSTTLANLLYHEKQTEIINSIDFDLIIETIIKNQ